MSVPTPTDRRLTRMPALDALRAFGATGVLAGHVAYATGEAAHPTWGAWLSRLEVCVSFFFVLSGFVLFLPFAQARATSGRRPGIRRHLWRRLLRIMPAYWVLAIVSLSVLQDRTPPWTTWLSHLTLTQFYGRGDLLNGVGPAWTLTVEVVFYLVLPFVALAALGRTWRPKRTVLLMAISIPVMLAWIGLVGFNWLSVYMHSLWFPTFAAPFGAGIALATVYVAVRTGTAPGRWRLLDDAARAPWTCWTVAVGLYAISTTPIAGPLGGYGIPTGWEMAIKYLLFLGAAIAFVIPAAFGPPTTTLKRMLDHPVLRWVGTVSFGLFLWHVVVIEVFGHFYGPLFGTDALPLFLITMAVGLVLAAASWYLIERPLQNWGRTVGRGRPRSDPGSGRPDPQKANGQYPGELRDGRPVSVLSGQ
jgi:peptidoglycan/LPS O-acetylase OafA/YrhL